MLVGLIPVFNEEKNIVEILNKLEKQVDFIIIVNDGSSDRTDFLISHWAKDRKDINYISLLKNKGMSYALLQGINFIFEQYKKGKLSNDDTVIMLDADGQHEPSDIKKMYEFFRKNNLDLCIAKRDFWNYPRYRIFGNILMSRAASWLSKFKFTDIECGFKITRVNFIVDLLKYYTGFRYSCAGEIGIMASLLGYKINNTYPIQVPYYRKRGPNVIDLFINLMFYLLIVLKIRFAKKR